MKNIFVGTSGWTYDDWSGRFYPDDVGGADRLAFYARNFNTVEVNSTFYRLPFKGMIKGWNRRLDSGFHLVVKGHRAVTHFKKIKNCGEPLERFLNRVFDIRTLRVILWQLPPSLHKDINLLDIFLSDHPTNIKHAVEFRHQSWWSDDVVDILARHNTAFVSISHPHLPSDIFPTTDFLYIRFHGLGAQLYNYDYSREELDKWAKRLEPYLRSMDIYAFFNNDFHANAPSNAKTFMKILLG